MRTFIYTENGEDNYVTITEKEILDEYYDESGYVSKETIIQSFCNLHKAEEVKI